ncbi:MAG: hypothetical protein ACRC1K_06670, partial [Planctomycetia bacterium]
GVSFPTEAFFVPIGGAFFTVAIAVDTIGHRTIYKAVLKKGEELVHHIIVFMGVGSCVLLCIAFKYPGACIIPAAILTILSFAYSWIDEALHWNRYLTANSDRVEMWSHAFILIGHALMMAGWWTWWWNGYVGVGQTLEIIAGSFG